MKAIWINNSILKNCMSFLPLLLFFYSSSLFAEGVIDLPRTGQTKCYSFTGKKEISCTGTGQDGEMQAGAVWPDPRFTNNGDRTITDNLTGLMWTRNAGTPRVGECAGGKKDWQEALDYVACLNKINYLGHNDWRLPNINELESLVDSSKRNQGKLLENQGFTDVKPYEYWSSTNTLFAGWTHFAWHFSMKYSSSGISLKGGYGYYVWPVRQGQFGNVDAAYPANVWKTGQTKCYDLHHYEIPCANTGQDGETQGGVDWPSPRFTDNGDGTVTDNLTGLMWLQDANCVKTNYPNFDQDDDGAVTWQHAFDFVKGINDGTYPICGAGYNDWRLPNRKELYSLIDYSQESPAIPPANHFNNLQLDGYWSLSNSASGVCGLFIPGGHLDTGSKKGNGYLLPVRAGQIFKTANLTVSKSGKGTITSNPSGINCGTDCGEAYLIGSTITLTAVPANRYNYLKWSGDCSGTSTTCTVTMDENKNAKAIFQIKK